jgi:hypothetical protein
MAHDDLLTSTQVGQLIGKSGRTVQRMADKGEIAPAQKLPGPNGAYLFRRAEVARFLACEPEDSALRTPA